MSADPMEALAAIDQSDTDAYYTALYMAAHEAVIAVGNPPHEIQADMAGNPGRGINYRAEVIMSALAAVCASFAVQSGQYPGQKERRLAADALRSEFIKQMAGFDKILAQRGAGIPASSGKPH